MGSQSSGDHMNPDAGRQSINPESNLSKGAATGDGLGLSRTAANEQIEPSIFNAIPHYLPLGIFPLILIALTYGGWWLVPPFVFMSVAQPADRALGQDGRNMNPTTIPARRLIWHNIPVWTWAFLWPLTLVFGMWQILVANPFAIWEEVVLVILLTMEAQAVFVVGHELVHRATTWERRMGEFLLASASYPQYASEHVYIHHAHVGTPTDVGSAPKGESFWRYFPKEIVSNLTNSWKVAKERLARRNLSVLHYSNPFWRYGIAIAFWYGLVISMGGIGAALVFAFLGLGCVFSMKLSNYFQHYGLRRVRLPNGRWEKIMPRHSWSADWKFSNWMFFNMQRHADHHAMASRQYPLLQVRKSDESPELPGTYGDMMNLVVRPKRWFEKMNPLVDQWREHFYPEIDDWSAYDSPISAARPDAFDAIVEIFGIAPRLAKWIERNPELLDNLHDREFTSLDLPKGFGPDLESESIARRGLTRLYWTHEMGIQEMQEFIAELPAVNAKESAEIVRNWSNDKAFQIGMHVIRENLSPSEAKVALSNLAEASISAILAAVDSDFEERYGTRSKGGFAAVLLCDLASREAYPGVAINMLFVHDGLQIAAYDRLTRRFRDSLTDLSRSSLLFSPIAPDSNSFASVELSELPEYSRKVTPNEIPVLTRARCLYDCGDYEVEQRFHEIRHEILANLSPSESMVKNLRYARKDSPEASVSSFPNTRGGFEDVERVARFLQLSNRQIGFDDPAPTAETVLRNAGSDSLVQAARLWRDLLGVQRLIFEEGFDASGAGFKVESLIARACGYEDFDSLNSAVVETAYRAVAEIETIASTT